MSQQCNQQRTEHAALGKGGVWCGGAGGGVDPDGLGFPSQKVHDLVVEGGVQTQQAQFFLSVAVG